MAQRTLDLGIVGLVHRGPYDASTVYHRNDLVGYEEQTWTPARDNIQGITPTEGPDWFLYAGDGSSSAAAAGRSATEAKEAAQKANTAADTAVKARDTAQSAASDAAKSLTAANDAAVKAQGYADVAKQFADQTAAGTSPVTWGWDADGYWSVFETVDE